MKGFKDGYEPTKEDLDNRSRQLDSEHHAFVESRKEKSAAMKAKVPNLPSKTGRPSGKGRGNHQPKK